MITGTDCNHSIFVCTALMHKHALNIHKLYSIPYAAFLTMETYTGTTQYHIHMYIVLGTLVDGQKEQYGEHEHWEQHEKYSLMSNISIKGIESKPKRSSQISRSKNNVASFLVSSTAELE